MLVLIYFCIYTSSNSFSTSILDGHCVSCIVLSDDETLKKNHIVSDIKVRVNPTSTYFAAQYVIMKFKCTIEAC